MGEIVSDFNAIEFMSNYDWAKVSDCEDMLEDAYTEGYSLGLLRGRRRTLDRIATWLEGQGQPGYAHEVRHMEK